MNSDPRVLIDYAYVPYQVLKKRITYKRKFWPESFARVAFAVGLPITEDNLTTKDSDTIIASDSMLYIGVLLLHIHELTFVEMRKLGDSAILSFRGQC